MEDTIFIQIASYRDPQLVPTLRNCIENASKPENLVFGICRQFCEDDPVDVIPSDLLDSNNMKVLDVPYTESKGVCWARNQVQQLYGNEKYTLQLDSHHRFCKDWDSELIQMLTSLQGEGYAKPLLTAYAPSFDPDNDPKARAREPWRMVFDRFIPEGAVFFLPETIPNWENLNSPVPARFYSAHMCFTLGQFSVEVQHDPNYYFHGEEISIAVRSFTHGYDLFHPHKAVIWHEYTRKNRTKHWDDHSKWHDTNTESHLRNRKLFEMDGLKKDIDFGIYDFGTERTLEDYEKYAGISFSKRGVQQYTLDHKAPPNPIIDDHDEYENSFSTIFKHYVDVQKTSLPESDYDCLVIAFEDEAGKELYRQDADEAEIKSLWSRSESDGVSHLAILRQFQTAEAPRKIVVWPHSKSKGWADRQEHQIHHCVS